MNKYDVIIIGSGLGGLLSAYILSKNGMKVLVLEKNNQIGGCLQTFTYAGEKFDTGMHYIGSVEDGQILYRFFKYFSLLNDVNLRKLDTEAYDTISIIDKTYDYAMGFDRFIDKMSGYFPNERENIKNYINKINLIASKSPLYNLHEINSQVFLHIDSIKLSVNEFIDSITTNTELRKVLAGNLPLYGGIKNITPLYIHALIQKFYINSAYRIVGGSDSISKSLYKSIIGFGGKVLTNSEVVKINCNTEKAVSVCLKNGEILEGNSFISNMHPYEILRMLDTHLIRNAYRQRITSLNNTISNFTIYIKFKPNTVKYYNTNFYHYNTPDVWGCENYNVENWPCNFLFMHQAPKDNSNYATSAVLIAYMRFEEVEKWKHTFVKNRGNDYKEFKINKSKILLNELEKKFPGINSNIESYTCSSPLTYRDYTATKDGSMYGILRDKNSPIQSLVSQKTKIPNLFMTGQNINSHGILGVTIGALITCAEYLGMNYLIKQIKNGG